MLTKFLDPKNDIAFRKIFGTEKNKTILIHFLNDMIVFKERKPIQDVTFLKTIQDPEIASKKTSIVDVLCRDEDNNLYVVEMQVADHKGFEKRAQYYAAKAYINQMNKGDTQYENLKEVIFLAIANFNMFPEKKAYKSDHVILDKETYENDLKDFSFTLLELKKFQKQKHELHTMIEKWSYYFKYAEETSEKELLEIFKGDSIILQAYEELNRFNWSEEELNAYEQEIKRVKDNQAVLNAQLEKIQKKYAEDLSKVKAEGKAEGIEEGKLKIARKLKSQGMNLESVSAITELPIEKLKDI